MFSPTEREEIRLFVHQEVADIERAVRNEAGSYNYLCSIGGMTLFTHQPMGVIVHTIPHY